MKYFVGIDVGNKGGIAVLDGHGNLVAFKRMPLTKVGKKQEPCAKSIVEFLSFCTANDTVVAIEDQHAMPNQGVVSMFNFGKGFGIMIGLFVACDFVPIRVSPRTWQKVMLPPKNGEDDNTKLRANRQAIDLHGDHIAKVLDVKANQGIADAILVAEYQRRMSANSV